MIIIWKLWEYCAYPKEDLYGLGAGGTPSTETILSNNSEAATALIYATVVLRKTQSWNTVSGHLCYCYNPSYSNDIYPVSSFSLGNKKKQLYSNNNDEGGKCKNYGNNGTMKWQWQKKKKEIKTNKVKRAQEQHTQNIKWGPRKCREQVRGLC